MLLVHELRLVSGSEAVYQGPGWKSLVQSSDTQPRTRSSAEVPVKVVLGMGQISEQA